MKKSKNSVKRIDWIDTLRGIAMFLVLWGHCQKNGTAIRKYIYSFHMPLFFFISGLTFGESDKMSFKDYLKRRVKGLIIPYIAINIVGIIVQFIYSRIGLIDDFNLIKIIFGTIYSSNKVLKIGCGESWFILSLFLVEMIFYFFKKNTKSDFELGIACMMCGIISYVNSISGFQVRGPWHFETALMGVIMYFIGYIFMKNIKKLDFIFNDKIRMFNYGLAFGLIGLVTQWCNRRVSMDANLYGSITLFFVSFLCTTFGLILFINLFMKKSKFFNNIGKNTIFYLGYHYMFILILKYLFPSQFNSNFWVLIISCGLTLFMYPLSLLVRKYFPALIGKINIKALN